MLDVELPVFVDEPAKYEPSGDHIVAKWKGREFHMPIAVAQLAANRLNRAIRLWHSRQNSVVSIPKKHR